MRARLTVLALAVLSAALAGAGLLLIAVGVRGGPPRRQAGVTRSAPAAALSPRRSGRPQAPSAGVQSVVVTAPDDGVAGDHAIQEVLDAGSPADLPPALASRLVRLGPAVWLAQITGVHRSAWPSYYFPAPAGLVYYHAARIQAAIARAAGGGRVRVSLVWAGTDPGGHAVADQPATVYLQQINGSWQPVR